MRMHRRAPRARTPDKGLARYAKTPSEEVANTPPASETRDSEVPPPTAAAPTRALITPPPVTPTQAAPELITSAPASPKAAVTSAAPRPRRTPLRRMPTELIMTTRMLPVRHPNMPGSEVRPLNELPPSEPEPAAFDRRPTAPIPMEAAKEAAELLELVDEREAALLEAELAQTVVPVRPRVRTPAPPPPAPVTAVARYAIEVGDPLLAQSVMPVGRHAVAQPQRVHVETPRGEHAPAHAAISGEYLQTPAPRERRSEPPPPPPRRHVVAYGPAPMHRSDAAAGYSPAALRHAVDTRAYEASAGVAYAAAPMHRADPTGGYAPEANHADFAPAERHYAAANSGYSPTRPRRASSTQWRRPNLVETEPDGQYAGDSEYARADDDLSQMRRQLTAALESARRHEQRAKEAELRASWAERYAPLQDPELEQRAEQRRKRLRWIKRVLEISCVGLALGGYISLLVPVRERVIAQDAMIHQLTALQQQMRDEKRALLQRIEEMQSGSEVTSPP